LAVQAVFRSWNGKRAIDYRKQFRITKAQANGTAVNICTMVFGNMGNDSGTGVGFTRNPGTGENLIYGEYLVNAQGEDVVAGIRTPKAIAEMESDMPEIYRQLLELHNRLESHYKEVQDFEFTIERGMLYCLQTRNGKMNAAAMVRTSVEMFKEGLITKEKALLRIDPAVLEQLLVPQLAPDFKGKPLATGLAASPGAASGKIVFDADTAEARGRNGERIILVREETKPEDIHGFFQAQGILTSRGGKTSHAAVVARGMGKPCVSGCDAIHIDDIKKCATIGDTTLHEGDVVTIDGGNGKVYAGEVPTVQAEFNEYMESLLKWADQVARLKVMANADTPDDAVKARGFGAMGIGLCRTERMFNATDRLPIVQEMILAESSEERQAALDRLLPIQRADFKGIFKAMKGLPVTVRLMDPPLHEFLPTSAQLELEIAHLHHLRDSLKAVEELPETLKLLSPRLYQQYADGLNKLSRGMEDFKDSHLEEDVISKKEKTLKKVRALSEVNPMLGHRGVRLGITYPEIYDADQGHPRSGGALRQGRHRGPSGNHGAAGRYGGGTQAHPQLCAAHPQGGRTDPRHQRRRQVRQHAGSRARLPACPPHGRDRAVLQFRHQRPDPGHLLLQPRGRREQVPAGLHRDGHSGRQSLRGAGPERCRRADEVCRCRRTHHQSGAQGRHLRRAWRTSGLDPFLPRHRAVLRFLFRAARTDCASRCRAGATDGLGRHGRQERVEQGAPQRRRPMP
jgi:pyruvate,orthophosphate dikinase